MGFMNQGYIPYCCLVHITEKKEYLTKIIKCDGELIVKHMEALIFLKKELQKVNFLKMIFFFMKEVKMAVKFMFGNVNQ